MPQHQRTDLSLQLTAARMQLLRAAPAAEKKQGRVSTATDMWWYVQWHGETNALSAAFEYHLRCCQAENTLLPLLQANAGQQLHI
jgi:hypothetical protein